MSNKKLRDGPGENALTMPPITNLPEAVFWLLFASTSFHSRWDALTKQESLIAENREQVLDCAHNFFQARTQFDVVAAEFFTSMVKSSLNVGDTRTPAEMNFYARWRAAFRAWRGSLELLMLATIKGVTLRTEFDQQWPPPPPLIIEGKAVSQRPQKAIQCQAHIMELLGYLAANLRVLDQFVRKEAPHLLLEVPAGPVQQ